MGMVHFHSSQLLAEVLKAPAGLHSLCLQDLTCNEDGLEDVIATSFAGMKTMTITAAIADSIFNHMGLL